MEEQEKYIIKYEMRSPQINELATALAKAQGIMQTARKDSENPFFRSSYADLASVWEACRKPFSENGLCIIQTTDNDNDAIVIITTLLHSSGQWICGRLRIKPIKEDPQSIGSAITYARRYALAAITGVAPEEDDDGEGAMGRGKMQKPPPLQEPQKKAAKSPLADPSFELLHVTQNIANVAIRLYTDKKTGKPRERYVVTDGNKTEYGTFDKKVADAAKKAMEAGIRAELGYKQGKYGYDLETIALIDIPPDRPVETRTIPILVCPEDEKLPASIFLCASCNRKESCPIAKEVMER